MLRSTITICARPRVDSDAGTMRGRKPADGGVVEGPQDDHRERREKG